MEATERSVIRLHIVTPSNQAPYTLEELARLAGISPALVQRYWDEGLIEPVAGHSRTMWFFDDNALYELRLVHRLRRELGVNIPGVAVIRELQKQIEELKAEIERLRSATPS